MIEQCDYQLTFSFIVKEAIGGLSDYFPIQQ